MRGSFIKGYPVNSNECLVKSNRWAKQAKSQQYTEHCVGNQESWVKLVLFLRNSELTQLSPCWEVGLVTEPCGRSREGNQVTGPEKEVSGTQAGRCMGSSAPSTSKTPQAVEGTLPPVWPVPPRVSFFTKSLFSQSLFSIESFFQD